MYQDIQEAIALERNEIINHGLYSKIKTLEDLKYFSQHHIFAVWDFMSLLKSLQIELTCTNLPWYPKGSANTRYLINEIVTGEESDVNRIGERMSHFEMYLEAMHKLGSDTTEIKKLLVAIQNNVPVENAIEELNVAKEVKDFLGFTFDIVYHKPAHVKAAVFTFGREDLIPDMFIEMVSDLKKTFTSEVEDFMYYFERHIEVDGDHHSKLAIEMVKELCGEDQNKWEEAKIASVESLKRRKGLWDAALKSLG
jgi:hypothetical protein